MVLNNIKYIHFRIQMRVTILKMLQILLKRIKYIIVKTENIGT